MGRTWVIAGLLALLGGCAVGTTTATYRIDGRTVTEAEFKGVFSTLKETGGWFCAETNTGGRTGWRAEDPKGVKYRYAATTDGPRRTEELHRE